MTREYSMAFLRTVAVVAERIDCDVIDRIACRLSNVRESGGRVFVVGVGGGAGNATHAVCDMRNLAGLEAYSATDNVATLTASINDSGWRGSIAQWLSVSRITTNDALMVFSVGGGSEDPPVSINIVEAVRLAKKAGAFVCGVVGPDGGVTADVSDECVRVPVTDRRFRTTHTEIYQSVVWHMLVLHPSLGISAPRWESLCP
ncbi:SIS domain-containing protein [Nocardia aurea]|uniref:SIS domain-containing protein n=1 Tax=Nocardia aurea TaxID=2144174 RepID=UPI000D6932CF|nr:SIS domain-containing protein [Nocardia aurea]